MQDELAVETIENSFQIGRNHPMIQQRQIRNLALQIGASWYDSFTISRQAGYTEAAVRGRVAGIDLTVHNQGTATYSVSHIREIQQEIINRR